MKRGENYSATIGIKSAAAEKPGRRNSMGDKEGKKAAGAETCAAPPQAQAKNQPRRPEREFCNKKDFAPISFVRQSLNLLLFMKDQGACLD